MRRFVVVAAAALTVVFAGVAPAQAQAGSASSTARQSQREWRAAHSGQDGPRAADKVLQTWGACGAFDSNTKVIRTFARAGTAGVSPYMSSGASNLACGSSSYWGYRHIVQDHLSQWGARASEAGENWRDTADYGIFWALTDPDRITYRASNDTYCFSRLINLVDRSNGRVVDHYYPNVVVAHVTKNIITAFPSSSQC